MRRSAALLLALAALAGCTSEGKVREPASLQDIVSVQVAPGKVWSESAGSGSDGEYAGLALALESDALFAAEAGGDVHALDPQTGARIWRAATDARIAAGPAVSGNAVLVGTLDAEVVALNRASGKELWRAKVSSEVMAPPTGDGDVVVARTVDGRVFGLSAVSGTRLWTFDRSVPSLTLRGLSPPLVHGNRVFTGMDNGRVAALRLNDGVVAWEQAVAVPSGRNELERLTDIDAPLLGEAGRIYAASFGGEVACLDGDNGEVEWRRTVKSYAGMALAGDKLVVADEAGVVWGLDAVSGAAAWKNEDLRYRKLSGPGAIDGFVAIGDFEGYVHWLDPKDGRIVGRTRAGSDPIRIAPLAAGSTLYVYNVEGKITALRSQAAGS